jgi:hypothetical protein
MYCLVCALITRETCCHVIAALASSALRKMFYSNAFSGEDLPRRRRAQAPSDNLRVGPDMEPWASGPSAPDSPPPQRDRRAPGQSLDAPGGGYAGQDQSQGLSYKERLAAERKVCCFSPTRPTR